MNMLSAAMPDVTMKDREGRLCLADVVPPEGIFDARDVLENHPEIRADQSLVLDVIHEDYCRRYEEGLSLDAAEFAEQVYKQICGFGEYGFPESHSASFALLAYVSAWLKHYEPAAFLAATLNSQPMGFYSPSVLVQDARRHGLASAARLDLQIPMIRGA